MSLRFKQNTLSTVLAEIDEHIEEAHKMVLLSLIIRASYWKAIPNFVSKPETGLVDHLAEAVEQVFLTIHPKTSSAVEGYEKKHEEILRRLFSSPEINAGVNDLWKKSLSSIVEQTLKP